MRMFFVLEVFKGKIYSNSKYILNTPAQPEIFVLQKPTDKEEDMKEELRKSFKIFAVLFLTPNNKLRVKTRRLPQCMFESFCKKIVQGGGIIIFRKVYADIPSSPGYALRKYSQQMRQIAKALCGMRNLIYIISTSNVNELVQQLCSEECKAA